MGCGSGGPALFLARTTGAQVIGVDVDEHGVAQANRMAQELGMAERRIFSRPTRASRCHSRMRRSTRFSVSTRSTICPTGWRSCASGGALLKPGGRLLFTDPLIVTGLLSSEEIAIRSSMGLAFFAPPGEDARLIQQAGLTLEREEDATANVTLIGERRVRARDARRAEVIAREGQETFDRLQRFYAMAQTLAGEGRLSRLVFLARKTP